MRLIINTVLAKMNSKWFILTSLNLIALGTICFLATPKTPLKNEETKFIATELNNIQSRLISLQTEIKKPTEKIDIHSINKEVNKLSVLVEQLKSLGTNNLNQLMLENRKELTHRLDAIQQVITSLDKKQHPIKYLPLTALPFKVLSIDSIQQVSVASVAYAFKTIPLEKSDKLAGWTVLQVDFGQQCLELENTNKERVVVRLQTAQGSRHA